MSAARSLAGYLLEERIAVGGMAEVHLASRAGPGGFAKQVAVKTILPELGRDPELVRMFLEEARLAARLSSPHLVQVFDAGEESGTYFMVMEYVEGADLAAVLRREGVLSPSIAVHIARQLCAGLRDLHEAAGADGRPLQIVHRDVNPANVLLSTKGDVKLGDFGIAKARARGLRTEPGTLKGKLAYLSPEQARGEDVDARADLYGVGLVLFEALTGERYLGGEGAAALIQGALQPVFRAPSSIRAGLPAQLDPLLARTLAVEAAQRHPSARLLDRELSLLELEGDPARAREELARMVQRARGASRSRRGDPVEGRAHAPAARAASRSPDREVPGSPLTEVLGPPAPRSRRWLGGLAVVALVLSGVALALGLLLQRPPGSPIQAAARADARPLSSRAPAAPDSPAAARPAPLGAGRDAAPRAVARSRPRRGSPAAGSRAVDAGPGRLAVPDQRSAATATARLGLARLRRLLDEKQLQIDDVPQLQVRLAAIEKSLVAGGDLAPAELEALEARVKAVVVDRKFVEEKLGRLNRRMAGMRLSPEMRRRLQQQGQQALSHAVTGRYLEANHALNEIARLLEHR